MRVFLPLTLVLILAACSGDEEQPVQPTEPSFVGNWRATWYDVQYSFSLTYAARSDTNVAGFMTSYHPFYALLHYNSQVAGIWKYPHLELIWSMRGGGVGLFSGTMIAPDTIVGNQFVLVRWL